MEPRVAEEANREPISLDDSGAALQPSPLLEQLLQNGTPSELAQLPTVTITMTSPNGNLEPPEEPAPPSRRRSELQSSPSVEQISRAADNYGQDTNSTQNIAELISLPPSEVHFDDASFETQTPPAITYRRTIERLIPLLPYLGMVGNRDVRNQTTGLYSYYDYDTALERSLLVQTFDPLNLLPTSASTRMRFIFLEDLDPDKIDGIGSALGIPPGFFASHLAGSGYCINRANDASRNNLWSRLRPGKGQFTMSWVRPVFLSVPLSLRLRDRILAGAQAPRLKCIFPSCQEGQSHKISTNRNIFRRPVSLSSQLGSDVTGQFPVGWEEKLSVWKKQVGECRIFVICLDPLPTLRYAEGQKALHDHFSPFFPLTARGDKELQADDVMTIRQAHAMERKHITPDSSEKTIKDWLTGKFGNVQLPQEGLLQILIHDIMDLTEVLRVSLEDIEEQSINLSPAQLQERALHWRPLLGRFQLELRQLSRHVPAFADFLFDKDGGNSIPPSLKQRLDETERRINDGLNLIERAYHSLRAELQIAEARRSIEEAESVAKLTELAFLFIPLTFAASLFSMQIQELQSTPPASYFVVTAIGFMGIAYAIRLMVRSSAIKQYNRHIFNLISTHADLSEGEHPSTRQFLSWLISALPFLIWEIFFYIFTHFIKQIIIFVVCGLLALPVIFLWRRGFNTGYSVMITLVLLPMDLTLLWVVSRSLFYGDWKSKLKPQRKRRSTGSGGTSVISSIAYSEPRIAMPF